MMLALEQMAVQVQGVLSATRTEILKMEEVLDKEARNTGTMSKAIEAAWRRTRQGATSCAGRKRWRQHVRANCRIMIRRRSQRRYRCPVCSAMRS